MSRNLPDAGGEQELWAQGTASAEAQSLGFQETSRSVGLAWAEGVLAGDRLGSNAERLQAWNGCLRSPDTCFLLAKRSL